MKVQQLGPQYHVASESRVATTYPLKKKDDAIALAKKEAKKYNDVYAVMRPLYLIGE